MKRFRKFGHNFPWNRYPRRATYPWIKTTTQRSQWKAILLPRKIFPNELIHACGSNRVSSKAFFSAPWKF